LAQLPDSTGFYSWGNMPAVDLVRLSANEDDEHKDLSLAFAGKSSRDKTSTLEVLKAAS
jgi:hypothetical protein